MGNESNKNRRAKMQRQEWNPHWSLKLLYGIWSVLFSAFKIAIGAAATVLLIVITCGIVFAGILGNYLQDDILPSAAEYESTVSDLEQTSFVYYVNKRGEIEVAQKLYTTVDRQWAEYDEIPENLINAAIAIEDKRFYEHQGVDWITTVKACLNMFFGTGDAGGSTITQQVIKNLTGNNEFSPERKIKEIFQAIKLNKAYSKEEVLKVYLNYVFFGNNCYGIAAAADGYFNKTVDELNLGEIATIIAITNNPTYYNPRTEKGMEHNKERRAYIFSMMELNGYITEEEEEKWNNYNPTLAPKKAETDTTLSEGWYIDQVLEDVTEDLIKEKGYTAAYADTLLKNGGLNIIPPFAQKSINVYNGRVEAVASILDYLKRQKEKYVIMADTNIAVNFNFSELLQQHIDSKADVTIAYTREEIPQALLDIEATKKALYYTLDIADDGRLRKASD